MAKTFNKGVPEDFAMLEDVILAYHPDLHEADVRVGIIMVGPSRNQDGEIIGPALSALGCPANAKISKVSAKDRVNVKYDAILQIDEHRWVSLTDAQQRALLDSQLCHLEVKPGEEGEKFALNDDGRPCLKIKPADFVLTGFEAVVTRHGADALEYDAMKATWTRVEQRCFAFMEVEKATKTKKKDRELALA